MIYLIDLLWFFLGHTKDEIYYTDNEESEEYDSNYEDDPLEVFIPVSYRGVQNVNHESISSSSRSKQTEYDNSLQAKYPTTKIGPYKLGEDVILRCISRGGQPLPNVTWWKDNSLLGKFKKILPSNIWKLKPESRKLLTIKFFI